MELEPRGRAKVMQLLAKGVTIPNPLTLDVGDEVDPDRISGDGVTLHAGCRLLGAKTVISAGVTLGAEAPVTLHDCRLGPKVELKGGYFRDAVFLEKANMGLGAQVREGCLLEEEANGAHCVGLKQTILLPFVTLGSLINFCDCLMAGGTSRKDHSEVGSSYIHFNFTPDGDKTTASLFGDVPRGVMLDQPPIFLGGQGGVVGPVQVGFGTVVAAGSILRRDVTGDGRLVVVGSHPSLERDFVPFAYRGLRRILANNIVYLANLAALEHWYTKVRRPFFAAQPLGDLVYQGALEMLAGAKAERAKRLQALVAKLPQSHTEAAALQAGIERACAVLRGSAEAAGDRGDAPGADAVAGRGEAFRDALAAATGGAVADYIETIQGLPPRVRVLGSAWLQTVVDHLCQEAGQALGTADPFVDTHQDR